MAVNQQTCFSLVSFVAFFIMSMSTPGPSIFANGAIAVTDFLNSKGLLGSSMNYTTCGMAMNCVRHTNSACKDAWSWQCPTYS